MKKTYTTFEQAISVYCEHYGECPTEARITDLYHKYRTEWKHYNGFADWMLNNV